MIADGFIKTLAQPAFERFVKMLGLTQYDCQKSSESKKDLEIYSLKDRKEKSDSNESV